MPDRSKVTTQTKKDNLVLQVEGLGVGLTTPPRKNIAVTQPQTPWGGQVSLRDIVIDEEDEKDGGGGEEEPKASTVKIPSIKNNFATYELDKIKNNKDNNQWEMKCCRRFNTRQAMYV